ncbi:MAG TPA: DNA-3-methyladenine glycosylase [Mycobacteriales bacterium]|nr:DNA-3-methyladenine glycosylase [Mycobacteriales bacterium]
MRPIARSFYDRPVLAVARDLLGCVVSAGGVSIRLTEVEAYDGANDAASHAYRGPSPRNAVMFGPPGHAYVYFTYGMHYCMNLVCAPEGTAAAVLLRAGEVVDGLDVAHARRPAARAARDLARGPARLCTALAVDRAFDGVDVTVPGSPITVHAGAGVPDEAVRVGPRVGISAAADWPYRFWIDGAATVSAFRPHVPRRRGTA